MTYQVTAKLLGVSIQTFDGIEAHNALEAINRVESRHFPKKRSVCLSGKNGETIHGEWTGVEFTARQLGLTLS